MIKNKKGDYKYGIILSLILGLMVLGISLYFVFNEYFTEEDADWEICRQSIQLRATLPEAKFIGLNVYSFRDDFPLKCKTRVANIEEEDVKDMKRARKIIGNAMMECWALYDNGDSNAFPSKLFGSSSVCVPCARIHLTEDAKKYMATENITNISIRESLDERPTKEYSYYSYLQNSGKKFSAFNFGSAVPFDLEGEGFRIDTVNEDKEGWSNTSKGVELINRFNGAKLDMRMGSVDIFLPKIFNLTEGDLIINYGIMVVDDGEFGDHVPYLFYFQPNQKENPFDEVKKDFVYEIFVKVKEALVWIAFGGEEKNSGSFCGSWEGIPA